jgi:hypothetical protein
VYDFIRNNEELFMLYDIYVPLHNFFGSDFKVTARGLQRLALQFT